MSKGTIGVTTNNIFPVIKKFLYSDHELFLRELVSNAVDATQKLKTLSGAGEFKGSTEDLRVTIAVDKEAGTLTVSDSGIGMTAEEIDKYINQIAFSGAEEFLEKYKDTANAIIGHFGLGFYSAFMVAKKVEIHTLSWQEGAKAVQWTCDGSPEFELEECDKTERGTDIILTLDDDEKEFLETARIEGLLKKYCRFLPVPIIFGKEQEWKDGKYQDTDKDKVINDVEPLWSRKALEGGFIDVLTGLCHFLLDDVDSLVGKLGFYGNEGVDFGERHIPLGVMLMVAAHGMIGIPIVQAIRLAVEKGKIVKLQEEAGDTGLDRRWNQVNMNEFLNLLSQFYTDTRFHEFYQQHQSFYQDALKAFNNEVMPYVHPEWFADFYGKPLSNLQKVVMGFATRDGGVYGTVRHLKGQPIENCPVVCYYGSDKMAQITEGMRESIANMITGMLSGSVDQSSDKNLALLGEIGTKLLSNNPMLGYNGINDGQTLMNKSLEKAANIIFMMENGSTSRQVGQWLSRDISSGFTWMPELVNALRDYTSHRNKYKTINDFYPQIAKVMEKYLDNEKKRLDKALK